MGNYGGVEVHFFHPQATTKMVGKTEEKQALRRARQQLPNKGRRAAVSGRYSPFTC